MTLSEVIGSYNTTGNLIEVGSEFRRKNYMFFPELVIRGYPYILISLGVSSSRGQPLARLPRSVNKTLVFSSLFELAKFGYGIHKLENFSFF